MEKIFNPDSIAVIGASNNKEKVGFQILANLINHKFGGEIYPINPNGGTTLGLTTYKSLLDIPRDVDLAVFAIPAKMIPGTLEACGQKGVKGVVVISAGFKETGNASLEKELLDTARELNIKIIGPNCLGIINPWANLNASFANRMPAKGTIGFFSQSGALCTTILDWAAGNNIGFSKFISIGNKADLDETDFIEYLADDDQTHVILGYIEGVNDGTRFIQKAMAATKKKPVILLKSGGTSAGARAASSHTGTLAGSEKAYIAAFKQTGIIRAESINEMFNLGRAFATQGLPAGEKLTIITNAGGCGIIAADACEKKMITLLPLTSESVTNLHKKLPSSAGFYNPIDILGDARSDRYSFTIETALNDPQSDGLLIILTPQAMTDVEQIAQSIGDICATAEKPVLSAFMGDVSIQSGEKILNSYNIPNYRYPEDAVSAFKGMLDYKNWRNKTHGEYSRIAVNRQRVEEVIEYARNLGRLKLGEKAAKDILVEYGFRFPLTHIAPTSGEAVEFAEKIGFPVVLKIASPDILHKTDIGGVRVGLKSPEEVENAFMDITNQARKHMPNAMIWGVTVQEIITGGKEIILGMSHDLQFGHMIMFGMGGIYVELLQDVAFRITPVTNTEAMEMIQDTKAYKLLTGIRGEEASDIDATVDAICRLSQLASDFPEIIELDINPLIILAKGKGTVALDARLQLAE